MYISVFVFLFLLCMCVSVGVSGCAYVYALHCLACVCVCCARVCIYAFLMCVLYVSEGIYVCVGSDLHVRVLCVCVFMGLCVTK